MKEIKKPCIIFSVYKAELTQEKNEARHESAKLALQNSKIDFKELLGCYKGAKEKSFLVINTQNNLVNVFNLADRYEQESILFLDEERTAELFFLSNGKKEKIGKLNPVSETEALKKDNWTLDTETKQYFTTESEAI